MAFSSALLLLSKHPWDPLQVRSNVCVAFSLSNRKKFNCVLPTPVYEIWKKDIKNHFYAMENNQTNEQSETYEC